MTRARINLVVDAAMFLCMAAVIGIGLLIRYVLLPGYASLEAYGRNVDLYYLGMDRHEWGTVHLYVAYALAALLVLHVVLHWKMVTAVYRRWVAGRLARWSAAVVLAAAAAALIFGFLFVEPEVKEQQPKRFKQGEFQEQQPKRPRRRGLRE